MRLTEQSLELVTVICKVIFLFNKSAKKIITIGASKESSDLILYASKKYSSHDTVSLSLKLMTLFTFINFDAGGKSWF
jgi:hypothetical protein